jgi:short-subunit dehydrogenase
VVFISSVVSSLPAPEYAVYAATKAALDSFAYNLRIELGDEVAVQLIHPGATRTDMHRKAGIPPERMDTSKFPPPEQVAAQIADAIERGKPQVAIGATNKLMRWAGRNAAKLVDTVMMRGRTT